MYYVKLFDDPDLQRGPGCSLEHFSHSLLALGWALQVGERVDLLRHGATLLRLDWLLLHLAELFDGVGIITKILKLEISFMLS